MHALITGHANERDRRVVLVTTPRFGIVGQRQTITFKIEDQGASPGTAQVTIRRDGEQIDSRSVAGRSATSPSTCRSRMPARTSSRSRPSPIDNELTEVNNRAVVSIDGVRDKLRVLLVSGEPHAGERTWRNLLKSDASVDLVHFTILRPPEKQDGTPINELSLIAFPTRELFQQKINDFQLIIFDRYARQGVLPLIYFDNIARYVRDGGAVLVAAGPDYASQTSLWRTPLEVVLPAEPNGRTTDGAFRAALTELGKRHPVTRGLEGADSDPPHWSQWFRLVDTRTRKGTAVMQGPDNKPLLVLSREGEGRVALLLSDHIWLWARGYEGGGPHIDLLRRLSHWLMKQPDLEEEALRMFVRGRDLTVQRQTMSEDSERDHADDAVRQEPQPDADAGRARRLALDARSQRTRAVARHRRHAHRARQCRAGQSARVHRGDIDPAGAVAARRSDRRRRRAHRGRPRRQPAARRRRRARPTPSTARTGSGCASAKRAWCAASACCRCSPD